MSKASSSQVRGRVRGGVRGRVGTSSVGKGINISTRGPPYWGFVQQHAIGASGPAPVHIGASAVKQRHLEAWILLSDCENDHQSNSV